MRKTLKRHQSGALDYSALVQSIIAGAVIFATSLLGRRGVRIRAGLTADLSPVVETSGIKFRCTNDITFYRADTLLTKEPDTIKWIDSMSPGDVLWDIGANVGTYTLYALKRGVRVAAFEPFAANYKTLLDNVALNDFSCDAFQVAMSATVGLDRLLISQSEVGSSRHNVGKPDTLRYQFQEVGSQGIATTTIDAASQFLGVPDHIKIDVDGLEQKIVAGGRETLRKVKSVLIEVDQQDQAERDFIVSSMESAGLFCHDGPHKKGEAQRRHYSAANMVFQR